MHRPASLLRRLAAACLIVTLAASCGEDDSDPPDSPASQAPDENEPDEDENEPDEVAPDGDGENEPNENEPDENERDEDERDEEVGGVRGRASRRRTRPTRAEFGPTWAPRRAKASCGSCESGSPALSHPLGLTAPTAKARGLLSLCLRKQ